VAADAEITPTVNAPAAACARRSPVSLRATRTVSTIESPQGDHALA
jgi:hypothetical protein